MKKIYALFLIWFVCLVLFMGYVIQEIEENGLKNIAEKIWYGKKDK